MDARMQVIEARDEKIKIRIRELTSYTYSIEACIIVIIEVKFANIGQNG